MYNRLLDTFLMAADMGSFSKAAEKLYISNTAVMKQMNLLEEQIGVSLFMRSTQGIQLTEAGMIIYREAKAIIQHSNEAIQLARKAAEKQQYFIRVGTSFLNPCKVIMDLWSKVNTLHPEFKIQVVPFDDDHTNILSVIHSLGQNFDIIAGVCSSKQWLSRCQFYELAQYPFCCAISRTHHLAQKKKLQIQDLYGETLMIVKRGDGEVIDQLRDMLEKEHPQIKLEDTPYFYDMEVFNRCEKTQNVLLTFEQWADIHPGLITIPVEWNYTNHFGILYSQTPSQDVIAFINALKELEKGKAPVLL